VITLRRQPPAAAGLDLHSHSWHSDGVLAPCEVARRMAMAGLRLGALTDHDTLAGVDEFRREAVRHGLAALPGVEMTCACEELKALRQTEGSGDPVEVHLLVYGIEPGQPDFEAFLAAIRAMRRERVAGMLARLRELGLPVAEESLARRLDTGSVGRPHLARLLVEAGHVRTVDEAFQRWLAEGRPAWLPKRLPELREALALARGLGGVALAAHPAQTLPTGAPLVLVDLGVDGLEARHPSHRAARVRELHELCRRNGLSASAGSDFHDPALGRYRAPGWTAAQVGGRLQALLEALA
jgi:predicted metal-dependent phosphoesterase TrpH